MSEKPLTIDDDLHRLPTDQDLNRLQRTTVLYYLHETNPDNGLVRDKTHPDIPCSIAAVGMALATIPVVVERGVLSPTGWWAGGSPRTTSASTRVMIENYRSGLIWDILRRCPALLAGLRRAGFAGGWL